MNRCVWLLAASLLCLTGCLDPQLRRGQAADDPDQEDPVIKLVKIVKDVTDVGACQPMPVSGVGLVCNLDGTGGGVPNGEYRKLLEDQLRKQNVQNVKELLSSDKFTMVLVTTGIPPGVRRGDTLDLEVLLPPQSKAKSLRGGILYTCPLTTFDTNHKLPGSGQTLLRGQVFAHGSGPLLVDCGDGSEEIRLRRGRIWEGAVSHIDVPFVLILKKDQKVAAVGNMIATRINTAFPDDAQKQWLVQQTKRVLVLDEVAGGINEKFHGGNGMGRGEAAQATKDGIVYVNVPLEYHLNPERYLHVVLHIPLRDTADVAHKYRQRCSEMLLDPKETIRMAIRLEAMGRESVTALKNGLASDSVLVRFASAEALAYLGSNAGIEELGRLAEDHWPLRASCLTAMASLNESVSMATLARLMNSTKPEVRIGAFRALLALAQTDPQGKASAEIKGILVDDAFWLHEVAPVASPMIHVATMRRAEIVIFGESPSLAPPFRVNAGEFTVSAEAGDQRCTVTRYMISAGKVQQKQSAFKVDQILQVMAELGGQYPEEVEFLRQADRQKCLPCALLVNAQPGIMPLQLLWACGCDANKFKDMPEKMQELLAAQEDLGIRAVGQDKGTR